MKWFFLIVTLALIPQVIAQTCITSSEDYAVEVVTDNYNPLVLRETFGAEINSPAQYDERLITIIKETTNPEGLSIRLQLPTEIQENSKPYLKLLSSSAKGSVKNNLASTVGRWKAECNELECEFRKDNLILKSNEFAGKSEVTLEIGEILQECNDQCSGVCIATPTSSRCLPQKYKTDIDAVLRITNLSSNVEELLESYRIVGSEELVTIDIVPQINSYVNWQEALRQELVYLKSLGIIGIDRSDTESIVQLAKRGQSGQNYRIVLDEQKDEWTYYDKTEGSKLTSDRDCLSYQTLSSETIQINKPKEKEESPDYFFVVPLVIGIVGFLLIILLALVASLINAKDRKKYKFTPTKDLKEWEGE